MVNQEIVMETTHGRKNKCKTEFKAVINKVLVSGVILATLMTSTVMPAYAATNIRDSVRDTVSYTQSYGVSVEDSIYEIRATIDSINQMRANGTVSDAMIQKLASQIYALGQAVSYSGDVDLNTVNSILNEAELAVKGVKGNTDVKVAISVTRAMLSADGTGSSGNYEDSHTVNQAEAAPLVSSFWDVKPQGQSNGHWGYESIMKMTEMGYFAGKGTNANGEATFAPNDTMTKAEFLTVVARILYDEDNLNGLKEPNDAWWSVYYTALVDGGVITTDEFKPTEEEMSKPMTRQEMSLIAVRTLEQRGENIGNINYSNVAGAIPDYNTIGTFYRNDVVKGYQMGLLCGVDDNGTFDPQGSLDRASATMVLYRIVEPSVRIQKDFSSSSSTQKPSHVQYDGTSESTAPITIKEGEVGFRRFAREGDTVIKADGTQVVLKKGPNGILGEGQGVAPDLGVQTNDGATWTVTAKNISKVNFSGKSSHKDSTGESVNNSAYYVNELTGEGHWSAEWQAMTSEPTEDGTFHMQLSADKNWIWNGNSSVWDCAYIQNFSDTILQQVLQANGL